MLVVRILCICKIIQSVSAKFAVCNNVGNQDEILEIWQHEYFQYSTIIENCSYRKDGLPPGTLQILDCLGNDYLLLKLSYNKTSVILQIEQRLGIMLKCDDLRVSIVGSMHNLTLNSENSGCEAYQPRIDDPMRVYLSCDKTFPEPIVIVQYGRLELHDASSMGLYLKFAFYGWSFVTASFIGMLMMTVARYDLNMCKPRKRVVAPKKKKDKPKKKTKTKEKSTRSTLSSKTSDFSKNKNKKSTKTK